MEELTAKQRIGNYFERHEKSIRYLSFKVVILWYLIISNFLILIADILCANFLSENQYKHGEILTNVENVFILVNSFIILIYTLTGTIRHAVHTGKNDPHRLSQLFLTFYLVLFLYCIICLLVVIINLSKKREIPGEIIFIVILAFCSNILCTIQLITASKNMAAAAKAKKETL